MRSVKLAYAILAFVAVVGLANAGSSFSSSGRVPVTATTTKFTSTQSTGANAFEVQTNGARIDFGAGASDYASSNGTTVTFAGPLASASTLAGTTVTGSGLISSTVATGNNGLAVTTNGARVDFGAGASDYASSDGTTVTYAGPLAAASTLTFTTTTTDTNQLILPVNTRICFNAGCSVWLMANGAADLNMQSIATLLTNSVQIGKKDLTVYTCSSTYPNRFAADTLAGGNTGKADKFCVCRSNGSNSYAYYNLFSATPTVAGTSTTCPD